MFSDPRFPLICGPLAQDPALRDLEADLDVPESHPIQSCVARLDSAGLIEPYDLDRRSGQICRVVFRRYLLSRGSTRGISLTGDAQKVTHLASSSKVERCCDVVHLLLA